MLINPRSSFYVRIKISLTIQLRKVTMKLILTAIFVVLTTLSFGQQIKFKIAGQKDTTVNLVRYFGKGLYYADTAEMKDGVAIFDGSKEKSGILALYLPGQQMLEFIFNGEEIYIETALPNLMKSAKIKKSDENKIFSGYISYIMQILLR